MPTKAKSHGAISLTGGAVVELEQSVEQPPNDEHLDGGGDCEHDLQRRRDPELLGRCVAGDPRSCDQQRRQAPQRTLPCRFEQLVGAESVAVCCFPHRASRYLCHRMPDSISASR